MIIQQAELAPINCPLKGLAQTITAVNYTVNFELLKFTFEGTEMPSIDTLKQLYPNAHIAGKLTPISFFDAQKIINRCLSFHVKGSIPTITNDTDLIAARFLIFWDFIKEEITLPCNQVFLHIPDFGTHFNFGIVWNFCIILLEDQKGLVISGNAYD